jgi:uncharacterized protein
MRIVIAGASGFLGTAWCDHLTGRGHEIVRLVRRPAGPGESRWDPYAGRVDLDLVDSADVVANVAGANVAHWPWTSSYAKTFTDSRVVTTRTLAEAVAASRHKPALVAQNGIAGYGDRGDHVVTESDPTDSTTLLAKVTREWEAATTPAKEAGARVVVMRTSVVLDKRGSAMKAMLVPFRLGLGGPIGSGDQYFPTVSLVDWLRAATYLTESDTASGVYNLTGPNPSTNAEFSRALADAVHRPAFLRVPAFAVRAAGPVSSDILGSVRLEPRRLLDEGFTFEHPTIEDRVRTALR